MSNSFRENRCQTKNGFYVLLGFQAPFGKEIHAAGKEVYVANSGSQVLAPDTGRTTKISFLERAFVKTSTTINDTYEIFQLLKKLSTAESKEIESLHKTFRSAWRKDQNSA